MLIHTLAAPHRSATLLAETLLVGLLLPRGAQPEDMANADNLRRRDKMRIGDACGVVRDVTRAPNQTRPLAPTVYTNERCSRCFAQSVEVVNRFLKAFQANLSTCSHTL